MKYQLAIDVIILSLLLGIRITAAEPWTVVDAVQSATESNPQALLAESLVEEARGERRSALSLRSPELNIRWDDIPSSSRVDRHEERRIGISQEIEFPLKYYWLKKAADSGVDLAESEGSGILLDLEADVRLSYLEAWGFSEQLKILEVYRDSTSSYSNRIQELSEYGGYATMDARRARMITMEAENDFRACQRSLVGALDKLSVLTGRDLTGTDLVSPLETDPVDTTDLFVLELDKTNPEILEAQSEVRISGCEKTLAATDWLPELEFTYYHRNEMFPERQDSWAAQIQLSVPLWFWWGGYGEVQVSKARLKRARAELKTDLIDITADYSERAQELKNAYEEYLFVDRELLPFKTDEYRLVLQNFPQGTGTYLDLIDIQDDLKDVQEDWIDIVQELYEQKVELDRLRGQSVLGK